MSIAYGSYILPDSRCIGSDQSITKQDPKYWNASQLLTYGAYYRELLNE